MEAKKDMNTRQIKNKRWLQKAGLALAAVIALLAGDPGWTLANDSNNQEPAQPQGILSDELPMISHSPLPEIRADDDFFIVATINNIGNGTPVVHYRFKDSEAYFTRTLHQSEAGIYGLKILSAALTNDKVEYYIEVTSGARTLATFGSESDPIEVKIASPKPLIWMIAAGVLTLASIFIFRYAIYSPQEPMEIPDPDNVHKKDFKATEHKYSRV